MILVQPCFISDYHSDWFNVSYGDADDVVPVKGSREAYKALKAAGADVEYIEFPVNPLRVHFGHHQIGIKQLFECLQYRTDLLSYRHFSRYKRLRTFLYKPSNRLSDTAESAQKQDTSLD